MSDFQLNLVESELKIVLEALTEMETRMSNICEASNDEDEVADIGNDLIQVRLLLKPLKEKAIKQFGENIVNFSRELL
ncbi:hypothetical protein [Simiduia agarivorans]|uniref:Uncharacterized protein n=1 Tax=Simiduia agarivorans (strain DSM 21679 / JCM 13881 / BCRC 17597 / SA1) TaxID=1117647 RepID=K4KK49_SIMAS|nr:hypothetical protein [Simiduia agarivorans]AFU99376.1 hypothetical protein M5M_10995 [Simiduia agarivorans SA1 = DSM 21679]